MNKVGDLLKEIYSKLRSSSDTSVTLSDDAKDFLRMLRGTPLYTVIISSYVLHVPVEAALGIDNNGTDTSKYNSNLVKCATYYYIHGLLMNSLLMIKSIEEFARGLAQDCSKEESDSSGNKKEGKTCPICTNLKSLNFAIDQMRKEWIFKFKILRQDLQEKMKEACEPLIKTQKTIFQLIEYIQRYTLYRVAATM
jgi:hypothetical protein